MRGDRSSWDAFLREYSGIIRSTVRWVLRARQGKANEDDVAELVQDVLVRLVEHDYRLLRTYDASRATLATWVRVIARSMARNAMRRKRVERVSLDENLVPPAAATASRTPDVEVPTGLLSARQRLVLHLLFDRDMEVREVARLLGVREQTVRSTKHKALERLRQHFGRAGGG